jgi:carbon-monoxide dehydrogenase medium subunit
VTAEHAKVEYCFPTSIEEAYGLKQQYGDDACYIAGGTDFLLFMERKNLHPRLLIDLTRIPELQQLVEKDGHISIGSAVTYTRLLCSKSLLSGASLLADAIRTIGGMQIRNVATLAGNLINASPAGDTLPPLYCLDAEVGIDGPYGAYSISINDFILGVGKTALRPAEIVTHVDFDLPGQGWYGSFDKLGLRRAMAISVVSVALLVKVENERVAQARISLGAVAPTVIRVPEAEARISMQALDDKTVEETSLLAASACTPITDVRASARYRREAVRGLVRRRLYTLRDQVKKRE